MLSFNSVPFGSCRKQLNDYGEFIGKLDYLSVEIVHAKISILIIESKAGRGVSTPSREGLKKRLSFLAVFAEPMQFVGQNAVEKAAPLYQLCPFEKSDKVSARRLNPIGFLHNQAELTAKSIYLEHLGFQPSECITRLRKPQYLRVDCALHCEPIAPQRKLNKLGVSLSLSRIRLFHHRDGPCGGSDSSEACDQCLIIRHELSPGIPDATCYGRYKKRGGNYQNRCGEDPSSICLWHSVPPATATKLQARCEAPCHCNGDVILGVLDICSESIALGQIEVSEGTKSLSHLLQAIFKKLSSDHHAFEITLDGNENRHLRFAFFALVSNFFHEVLGCRPKVVGSVLRVLKIDRKLAVEELVGFFHLWVVEIMSEEIHAVLYFGYKEHLAPNVIKTGPGDNATQLCYCPDDGWQDGPNKPADFQSIRPQRQRHHLAVPPLAFSLYFSGQSESVLRLSLRLLMSKLCSLVSPFHGPDGRIHFPDSDTCGEDSGQSGYQSLKLTYPGLENRKCEGPGKHADRPAYQAPFQITPHKNRPQRISNGIIA